MTVSGVDWPAWLQGGGSLLALGVVLYDKFTGRLTRVVVESETLRGLKATLDATLAEMKADLAEFGKRLDKVDAARAGHATQYGEINISLKGLSRDLERMAALPGDFKAHEARDEERFESIKSQLIDLKQAGREDQAALGRRVAVTEAQIARVAPRALRAVRDE